MWLEVESFQKPGTGVSLLELRICNQSLQEAPECIHIRATNQLRLHLTTTKTFFVKHWKAAT
jgi:hypothetical protein